MYCPIVGRFTTMDDYAGETDDPITLNKYIYANADPVNMTDPSGHDAIDVWENEGGALGEVYGLEEDIAAQQVDNLGLENLDDLNASTPGLNQQFSNVLQDVVTNAQEAPLRLIGDSPVSLGEQEVAEKALLDDPDITITENSLENDFSEIDQNRLNHIFNNPGKNWGPLLSAFQGDQAAAMVAMEEAGQEAVQLQGLADGIIQSPPGLVVNVGGTIVKLGGRIIAGVFRLGTATPI
jgi:hypothetical protein